MSKKIFCQLLMLISYVAIYSQSVEELTMQHKQTMKTIKKAYGLNKIEVRMEEDGYWYFYFEKGYWKHGIANQNSKIIVPAEYSLDHYHYLPKLEEGNVSIPCYDEDGNYVKDVHWYHKAYDRAFLANNKIVSTEGIVIKELNSSLYTCLNGLIIGGNNTPGMDSVEIKGMYRNDRLPYRGETYVSIDGYSGIDLYTWDGECILQEATAPIIIDENSNVIYTKRVENKYVLKQNIKLNKELMGTPQGLAELQRMESVELAGLSGYKEKINNRITRKGALSLKGEEEVPCMFADVYYDTDHKIWMVKRKFNAPYEHYDPNGDYTVSYIDIGEVLFEQGDYKSVIDYYAEKGVGSPYEKYLTALALRRIAEGNRYMGTAQKVVEALYNRDWYFTEHRDESFFDLDIAGDMLNTSNDLLSAYMAEDSTYYENAVKEKMLILKDFEEIDVLKRKYTEALEVCLTKKTEASSVAVVEFEKYQAEKRAQQAKIASAVLNIFIAAMINSTLNASTAKKTSSSLSSSHATGSSVSRNTSSSTSSNTGKKVWPEWAQKQFRFAKNKHEEAKEELLKAEKRLVNKNEPDVLLNQYVEQCRRHVKDWEQKMEEYAAVRE